MQPSYWYSYSALELSEENVTGRPPPIHRQERKTTQMPSGRGKTLQDMDEMETEKG